MGQNAMPALKDYLASLANVAPDGLRSRSNIDAEDEGNEIIFSKAIASEDSVPEHYVRLPTSRLRKVDAVLESSKYQGQVVTRNEFERGEAESFAHSSEDVDGTSITESISEEQIISDENEFSVRKSKRIKYSPQTQQPREDSNLLKQLHAQASIDSRKSLDVKKQLLLMDNLLTVRIRLQALLAQLSENFSGDQGRRSVPRWKNELILLLRSVATLQKALITINAKIDYTHSQSLSPISDFDDELMKLEQFKENYQPFLKSTIVKWSDKVSIASTSKARGSTKFINKAVDRNVFSVIEDTMALQEQVELRTLQDTTFADIDERNFYHTMLQHGSDGRPPSALSLAELSKLKPKSKKPKQDLKFSKGRQLRYTVHDKLVNFMVPRSNPEGTPWNDDQIDDFVRFLKH